MRASLPSSRFKGSREHGIGRVRWDVSRMLGKNISKRPRDRHVPHAGSSLNATDSLVYCDPPLGDANVSPNQSLRLADAHSAVDKRGKERPPPFLAVDLYRVHLLGRQPPLPSPWLALAEHPRLLDCQFLYLTTPPQK